MMNVDVMRQLVAEAELGDKDMKTASASAALWGCDVGSLRDWRCSANAIYRFTQESVPRFIRLTWSDDRQREQVEAELEFVNYLVAHQFPAVQPIPSLRGNYIEPFTNPYGLFYAVTFTAARGQYLHISALDDQHINTWGKALGHLHNLSTDYGMTQANQRPGWREILERASAWIPDSENNMRRYLREASEWLLLLPISPAVYGLIHWDFEPDNLSWQDGKLEVYDFDDAAYFWYAADIAFAMDSVLEDPPSRASHIIGLFLDAYTTIRPLNHDWIEKLPLFVRLMRVLKATRLHHAYVDTHPELDPAWLKDLRERHSHQLYVLEQQFNQPFTCPMSPQEMEIWGKII